MGGCISCLVSDTCAGFCGGLSVFAIIILLLFAWALSLDPPYRYIGRAWVGTKAAVKDASGAVLSPSRKLTVEEAQGPALKLVLKVVGIYAIFLGLSVLCFLGNAAKRKFRPTPPRRRSA